MNWQTTLADLGLILLFIGAFTLVVVRIAGRKG
jgi:flagellar biogenesis protein FliO